MYRFSNALSRKPVTPGLTSGLTTGLISRGSTQGVFSLSSIALLLFLPIAPLRAQAVPPPVNAAPMNAMGLEDVPEEILRQELIFDARSPLNGAPLTATEYAELQAEIEHLNQVTPQVSPKLQQLIMLVKLRKFIKTVLPIVPIK